MAGNGPAGNPNAIRRNARVGVITLPSEGRTGDTPPWKLPPNPRLTAKIEMLADDVSELEEQELEKGLTRVEQTKLTRKKQALHLAEVEARVIEETEVALWAELWTTPQAVEWERLRWFHDVALYVRYMAAAQVGDLDAGKEARQWSDRLGLSPRGMKALMWRVAVDEVGAQRQAHEESAAATGTEGVARPVLVALEGGGSTVVELDGDSARPPAKKATRKRPAKKATAKKATAKKATSTRAARKQPAKKTATKKPAAKKTTPRKKA